MLLPAMLLAAFGVYFDTGEGLFRKCIAADAREQYMCFGYITAVSDAIVSYKALGFDDPACVPMGTTRRAITDEVVAYLRANPGKRDRAASDLVILAIRAAYPCGSADMD